MNGAQRHPFCAPQEDHIGSVDPDALKIPARRAEYSLTESALSPSHAEPTQKALFLFCQNDSRREDHVGALVSLGSRIHCGRK